MNSTISIIMIPLTTCNLHCKHCFNRLTDTRMDEDDILIISEKLHQYAIKHHIKQILFYWQGGELLILPPSWFDTTFKIINDTFSNTSITIEHNLQSNLISYDQNSYAIIDKYFDGNISSSIDYPNKFRGQKGCFNEPLNQKWKNNYTQAKKDGLKVGAISLLNEDSLKIPPAQFIQYYVENIGLRRLQINLPFSPLNESTHNFFLDPNQAGEFLSELFQIWVGDKEHDWFNKISISPFDNLIKAFTANDLSRVRTGCIWSGNCVENFIAIGPNCDVSLCDCWVTGIPDYKYGNLRENDFEEVFNSPKRKQIAKRMSYILNSDCADCDFLGMCFGGCIVRSYLGKKDIYQKDYYCKTYQILFNTILEYATNDY